MDTNLNPVASKGDSMSLLFEQLYDFHFKNQGGQLVVYLIAFFSSFLYMAISGLVFSRPQQDTIAGGLILAVMVTLGLPVIYCINIIFRKEDIALENELIFDKQKVLAKAIIEEMPETENLWNELIATYKNQIDKSIKIERNETEGIITILFHRNSKSTAENEESFVFCIHQKQSYEKSRHADFLNLAYDSLLNSTKLVDKLLGNRWYDYDAKNAQKIIEGRLLHLILEIILSEKIAEENKSEQVSLLK